MISKQVKRFGGNIIDLNTRQNITRKDNMFREIIKKRSSHKTKDADKRHGT